MTVKELRKLLQGAKPDAQIVVHINQARTYHVLSVDHNNVVDDKGKTAQVIDIRIGKRK